MMHAAPDQALGLRRLLRPAGVRVLPVFGTPDRLPAIVNLASALARARQQVLVVDASRGEIAPAFGLAARYELKHVLEGDVAFDQAALSTRDGVQVLPAARGLRLLTEARVGALDFFESLAQKAAPVDLILVNCESAESAARLLPAHGEALLVLTRGPQAVSDGAMCLAGLARLQTMRSVRVLMLRTLFEEARQAVTTLAHQARARLGIQVSFGGAAPPDRGLWEAARVRRSVFDIDPAGPVARAFHNIAASLLDWELARVTPAAAAPAAACAAPPRARAVTQLH